MADANPIASGLVLSVHSRVISPGQSTDGGVVSSMIIVCRQVLLFPQASVAIQVLDIVDSCGQVPGATESL